MVVFADALYFILRYIPWWSIPMLGICGYFAYVYWLKDIKRASYGFVVVGFFCFVALAYYIWMGSPDRAAGGFDELIRTLKS